MGTDVEMNRSRRSLSTRSFHAPNSSILYRKYFGSATSRLSLIGDYGSPEDQHHARLGEYAVSLWKEKMMTDVMVVVGDSEFKAHKAVLACYSPYFKEVLLKPGANDVHYLEIPCVTAPAFQILLSYMYTGDLQVTCQDLADVYRAARRLGMKDAIGKCLELLTVSTNSIENTIYLYVTAKKLDLMEPSVRAFRLMVAHFETLVGSKEFLDLEIDQVVDFFSVDEIGARSEVMVYLAALYWLDYKFLEREQVIDKLMSCVRFPMMTMDEILLCYHPPLLPGITLYPCVREALFEATCYIAARSRGQEEYFRELSCKTRRYLLGGLPALTWDFQSLYNAELYPQYRDRKAATKIQAAFRGYITRKKVDEELRQRHLAAAIIQSAFRGHRVRKMLKEQPVKEVKEWDSYPFRNRHIAWDLPTSDIIRTTPMSPQRDSSSSKTTAGERSVTNFTDSSGTLPPSIGSGSQISQLGRESYQNVMYVVGAFDPTNRDIRPSNAVMSYIRSAKAWKDLDPLPEPRQNVLLAAIGDFLYFIGGCEVKYIGRAVKAVPRKECFCYHVRQQTWIDMAPMKVGRMFHGVATSGGRVYAIGGKDYNSRTLASIECYDPSSNRWSESLPMSIRRMGMGVAAHNGMIWISGGFTGQENQLSLVDIVECFDVNGNRRFLAPQLPRPIAFAPLVSCQGRLFLIGGAHQPVEDSSGLESLSTVYVFDEGAKCWKIAADLPKPLHSVIACSLGEDIYILGGYSAQEQKALDEVFYYDTVQRRWRTCCPLPPSVGGYVLAAVGSDETQ